MLFNKNNLSQRFLNTPLGFTYINSLKEAKFYKAEDLGFQRVKKVEVYKNDLLLLTEDGNLYYSKKLLMSNVKDVVLSLSENYFFVLDKERNVFSMGKNGYGQLGQGSYLDEDSLIHVKSLSNKKVTQIAAGYSHSLALTADGDVYAWGSNNSGQLGLEHWTEQTIPQRVTFFNTINIVSIASGGAHSFAITAEGIVYSWGSNWAGQLGLGHITDQATPQRVTFFDTRNVVSIVVGSHHSLALTAEGNVYSWGHSIIGQLGLGNTIHQTTPQRVTFFDTRNVISVSAGCYHSFALTADGNVYAWGRNVESQLGLGNKKNRYVPTLVPDLKLS